MGHGGSRFGVFALGWLVPLVWLLSAGCIVHGDYVRLCEFRGTVVDAASGEPLANAWVHLTTQREVARNRSEARATTTDSAGRFAVELTIGGGSVTWLLFIPMRCEESLGPIETVFLEVGRGSCSGRSEVSLSKEARQRIHDRKATIDLGEIEIRLSG